MQQDCRGECLVQSGPGKNDYYRRLPHTCTPIPCPNYRVCGAIEPQRYLDCHGGRCQPCNMFFGENLHFTTAKVNCQGCNQIDNLVLVRGCPHLLCPRCFYRCFLDHRYDQVLASSVIRTKEEHDAWSKNGNQESDNAVELTEEEELHVPKWFGKCPICNHHEPAIWDDPRPLRG